MGSRSIPDGQHGECCCYIAGPMTGIPLFNFPEFDRVRDLWSDAGWFVTSPADIDREMGFDPGGEAPANHVLRDMLARDAAELMLSDAIVLLDGWLDSRGAVAEVMLAIAAGLVVYDERGVRIEPAWVKTSLADRWHDLAFPPAVAVPEGAGETVLEEAQRLVYGPRRADYGHPADDYARVTGAFNALTGKDLTAADGILFMLCVKMAREAHRPKRDNRVDLAGYAACLQLAREREGKA